MWGGAYDGEQYGRALASSTSTVALGRVQETERLFNDGAWAEVPSFLPRGGVDVAIDDDLEEDHFRRLAFPERDGTPLSLASEGLLSLVRRKAWPWWESAFV